MQRVCTGLSFLVLTAALLGSCGTPEVTVEPPEPVLRRLSADQYYNSLRDHFGSEVVLPPRVEPDTSADGFVSVGNTLTTISPRGVELYEEGAYDIAEQVMADTALRDSIIGCAPAATSDTDCARAFVTQFGHDLWRRPLTAEEADGLVALQDNAAVTLDDWYEGTEFVMAAMLQSPNFLFRAELGEPDPDVAGAWRYTDYEMASRLSFFLWNTTPDDELLQAAADGELTTEEGLEAQVDRLLDHPRARDGAKRFFYEMLRMDVLEDLSKDTLIFTHMSDELGNDAQQESLLLFEHMVFDEEADYRDLFTTRTTFLNNRLASLYNVQSPSREGFAVAELPEDGMRRGLLGHASVLAHYAHPVRSSPTLRGKFVREVVLCQTIPPPPSGVDTSIPEPSGTTPTMRERVAEHLADPTCAGCHQLTDPIGLGLENFDGIGRFRWQDNEHDIDASGDLDGDEWVDPLGLTEAVADHPDVPPCLVHNMYRYGTGHAPESGETDALLALEKSFKKTGYRVRDLMHQMALSPAFRTAADIDTEAEPADE